MKTLKLDEIRIDGGTQIRAQLSEETIADYAETYREGGELPPVEVMFDGKDYWLWEGFHRWHARARAGLGTIEAHVTNGTQRDAVLKACGANAEHGLKRSNADKRSAVKRLLADKEWAGKSDRWIAEHCKVGRPLVAELREHVKTPVQTKRQVAEKPPDGDQLAESRATRRGKDGKTYKMPEPPSGGDRQSQIAAHFNGKVATKNGAGKSPAKLADKLATAMGPIVRGLETLADINGGRGKYYHQACEAQNSFLTAVKAMRKGEL